ncbi:MAG: hypothetical protein DDT19_02231 [Syntrophomonadaceae bacterium]|nr:hypothetical protein [Bacillota bacterium]
MPVTITRDSGTYGAMFPVAAYASGDFKLLTGSIAFDSSYAFGGEPMDLRRFFTRLLGVIFESRSGYSFEYDYAARRVRAFEVHSAFTATIDPPSIAADSTANVAVAVPGVVTTDRIHALPPAALENGLVFKAVWASAANEVTIRLQNTLPTAVDGVALVWTFLVFGVQLREVRNLTNLSALTGVRFSAWGY